MVDDRGKTRARFLLMKLLERARELQVGLPATVSTPYINTIPPEQEPWFPGDEHIERRIRAFIRWNAAVMVTRANKRADGHRRPPGHLRRVGRRSTRSASTTSSGARTTARPATRSTSRATPPPASTPGPSSRAASTEDQLDHFRQEIGGGGPVELPAPPAHARLLGVPDRLHGPRPHQRHLPGPLQPLPAQPPASPTPAARKVWCFVGDGECDEPESLGALTLAAREQLDNLIFVVNCNLQRLDGPVRGNGKIIQELEAVFRGAGWNVIKVIWGSKWDELLARDVDGVLLNKMNTTVDGEFQKYAVESGAYIREHFFGPDPRLRAMVEHLSDDELRNLPRGGHDYRKLYAAYKAAVEHEGAPTVILAKTVKGWTLGPEFEARNATHQIKKMTKAAAAHVPGPPPPPGRDPRRGPRRRRCRPTTARPRARPSTST